MNKINKVYSVHVLKVPVFCFLGLYYNHISQTVIFSVWSLFDYIMPKRKDISSDLREAIVPRPTVWECPLPNNLKFILLQ